MTFTRRTLMALGVTALVAGLAPRGAADEANSMIRSIAYDAATQTLTVVMAKDGRTYRYSRVPEKVYRDFQMAKSKGTFYLLYIKGRYEFTAK